MADMIDRRRFLQLAGVTAGATALAGTERRLLKAGAMSTPQGAGTSSKVVHVGMPSDPLSLDPVKYNDPTVFLVTSPVVEALYKFDNKLNLVPVLASGQPQVNADATRWEVPLRSGVTFHNGKSFTSDDVKFTIDSILNPSNASTDVPYYSSVSSVETSGPNVVVFNLNASNRYFGQEALIFPNIVPSNVPYTPSTYADKMIGTGPFRFVEWVHGQKVVLTRNDNYWRPGLPHVAGVQYAIIPTTEGQIAGLANGSLQLLPNLPPPDASVAESRGVRLYLAHLLPGVDWIWPNWSSPHPTADVNMRLAINWALNRRRIVEVVYKGFAQPESTIPSAGSLGYDKAIGSTIPPEGDLARARRYLTAAGGPPKSPLIVVFSNANDQASTEVQLISQDLAAIGIKTTIRQESVSASTSSLTSGAFDLYFLNIATVPTPNQAREIDDSVSPLDFNHVNDPQLTALANQAANDASVVPQVQRRALQVVPQIATVTYPSIFGVTKSLRGFTSTFGGSDVYGLVSTTLS